MQHAWHLKEKTHWWDERTQKKETIQILSSNLRKCCILTVSHRIHGTGIFIYIQLMLMVNVGKYTIHGSYGYTRILCENGCVQEITYTPIRKHDLEPEKIHPPKLTWLAGKSPFLIGDTSTHSWLDFSIDRIMNMIVSSFKFLIYQSYVWLCSSCKNAVEFLYVFVFLLGER